MLEIFCREEEESAKRPFKLTEGNFWCEKVVVVVVDDGEKRRS